MAASDALIVVEDWISEHYFNSESRSETFHAKVLVRRTEWDKAEGGDTTRTRFLADRRRLEAEFAVLYEADTTVDSSAVTDLYRRLRDILGFGSGEFSVKQDGPVLRYGTPGVEGFPLVIIEGRPAETLDDVVARDAETLLDPYQPEEDEEEVTSIGRLLSRLFLDDSGPSFALVLAGRWAVVADRDHWAEGRYLGIDLQAVAERNDGKRGGEIDKALTCLDAASLGPDADGDVWWTTVLAESVKHTVGVSKDLREGVRRSIEIIANEVVARRAAQGMPPLPQDQAQPLAVQSLRYLYRILFLLYAEASPELGVLPVGAPEYGHGYSLDRLRELVLNPIASQQSRHGTHFYESLQLLFRLVDRGHRPAHGEDSGAEGLEFNELRADLFAPPQTALIDETGLGNFALQQVLQRLLLSKQSRGRDRGFISYVDLGINQLGAVYEGLMSYTGFFAETDLYEVAKNGNPEKGSWVVRTDRIDDIAEDDFVRVEDPDTGELKPVLHRRGTFVYRLSGRERQQSASYYTPEVLTRFTVSQALAELLDQDGRTTTAEEILSLTVCEPALGSGAFAIEAVRQLAAEYLERRQNELGEKILPEDYPTELQRVKAYLALHQVYGVDLNETAVELAEVSLWLDTMAQGLQAPWFGLRLRRGNSLIGARHAFYTRDQVTAKTWLDAPPEDVPVSDLAAAIKKNTMADVRGRIHHFLVPAAGWGATADAKEAKELAPVATDRLKEWRKRIKAKPTKKQVDQLVELSRRVETLWQFAYRRLEVAERESWRDIPLWGRDSEPHGSTVSREEIERTLANPDGAYQRLRMIMDAWCALWFWPLHGDPSTQADLPSLDDWLGALKKIAGQDPAKLRKPGMDTFAVPGDWAELGDAEELDLQLAVAEPLEKAIDDHPWLSACAQVAKQQGFFHWELDFATVFGRDGFDLQLGNPPWVRPRTDVDALMAEGDPWWQLALKPTERERAAKRTATLARAGIRDLVISGTADLVALAEYIGTAANFPLLGGLQPDLYRCFISSIWRHASKQGASAVLHYETHFTDEKAAPFRAENYHRLRRHWEFINELKLFEIQNQKHWGLSVFGSTQPVHFLQATNLYHPDTVTRSLTHDGSGPSPGLKDDRGAWDLRPHADRIVLVDDSMLRTWHEVLEDPKTPIAHTRMLYTVNRSLANVLAKMGKCTRLSQLDLSFSRGWDESIDRKKGRFAKSWGLPDSWSDAILQGSHIFVNTPFYKSPNPTLLNHRDWSVVDLEDISADAIPVTAYKPAGRRAIYDAAYTHWGEEGEIAARDHYRVAWRRMAANTGERTLISAIVPPGTAHVHPVSSAAPLSTDAGQLIDTQAILGSLIADFSIRSSPKGDIHLSTINRLPMIDFAHELNSEIRLRVLRLNCVTDSYSNLWHDCYAQEFQECSWTTDDPSINSLEAVKRVWSSKTPLRGALERRQAQVEIDALVAIMLGVTADELCTVYRTQFAVLYGYDHNDYTYDVNGRLVPNSVLRVWRAKGDRMTEEERTATNQAGNTYVYELPFRTFDREEDMRRAYAEFKRRMRRR